MTDFYIVDPLPWGLSSRLTVLDRTCSNGAGWTFPVRCSYPKGETSQLIETEEAYGKTDC